MIIGLTGGIGSGKSTILSILKNKYNFEVIETDKLGHEIMEPGKEAYFEIIDVFGKEILQENGMIDRQILGNIVFNDDEKLKTLNKITHEAVINEIKNIIQTTLNTKKNQDFVVETALMYESGLDKMCDEVWYVYASHDVRVQRLIQSRNLTKEKIKTIMKKQLEDTEFKSRADVCIDNSKGVAETEKQLEKLLVIHAVL